DDGFFPVRRDHAQFDFAHLKIEHGIRHIPLRKENLLLRALQRRFAIADLIEVGLRIKRRHRFNSHGQRFSRERWAKLVLKTNGRYTDLFNQTCSYPPHEMRYQPYPTRRKAIWSILLSLNGAPLTL